MRLFHVFLSALCWAALGQASQRAIIFEMVYYYYAYQIEVAAFPESDRYIAYECSPATGTVCTFNEFLKTTAAEGKSLSVIPAGDTTSPPIEDADKTFSAMKWGHKYRINQVWKDGDDLNHVALSARVTNRIQEAREVRTIDKNLLSSAKEALEAVQAKRWEDNFVHLEQEFQKRYEGVSLYDTETTVDGSKIKVIDWVKTAAVQASKSSSKSKVLLKRYQDWIKGSNGKQYRDHLAIAQNIASLRNVLDAEPSCRA
ncbi:transcription factor domain family protein [Aspergillus tubingensis]|uniref:Uncharacterized protein n=1 Tax=Aspergillus tubingensis (strain CBS 134.48) TaxID=767770 RepID=A0A1L9NH38_ASPTC|nr:fungal specific transcription factor domain family protein [Aspergillus tubingensis]OJI88610.1 hypothetical protein ASPTUDRAFT_50574 [Aspergillus tubingensis CBS 134.48]GFN13805.1 fungal specific transcription factor domain family protein [Aspergillus tubingensis]